MSKLRYLVENLRNREDVVLLEDRRTTNPFRIQAHQLGNYHARIDVAPACGLYTADKLQEFMKGLLPPNMMSYSGRAFSEDGRKLYLGRLDLTDDIGVIEIYTKITFKSKDKILMENEKFDGEKVVEQNTTQKFIRDISVDVFPSEQIWQDINEGKLKGAYHTGIPLKYLRLVQRPQQKKLLARLLGR